MRRVCFVGGDVLLFVHFVLSKYVRVLPRFLSKFYKIYHGQVFRFQADLFCGTQACIGFEKCVAAWPFVSGYLDFSVFELQNTMREPTHVISYLKTLIFWNLL